MMLQMNELAITEFLAPVGKVFGENVSVDVYR